MTTNDRAGYGTTMDDKMHNNQVEHRRRNLMNDDTSQRPPEHHHDQADRGTARPCARDRALLDTLCSAEIVDCKLVPWGSNYTFAVALDRPGGDQLIGIYKPKAGEAPLWDFDSGSLYRREYASYLLSRALGWHFIPPTVVRDGPHGIGTVQLYIEPDGRTDSQSLLDVYGPDLRRMLLFDLITNNGDRKAGHLFVGKEDRALWGIDHGLTFHVQPKLRTVVWEFCDEPIAENDLNRLGALCRRRQRIESLLAPLLHQEEIDMVFRRIAAIRAQRHFPSLNPRRNIPYGW